MFTFLLSIFLNFDQLFHFAIVLGCILAMEVSNKRAHIRTLQVGFLVPVHSRSPLWDRRHAISIATYNSNIDQVLKRLHSTQGVTTIYVSDWIIRISYIILNHTSLCMQRKQIFPELSPSTVYRTLPPHVSREEGPPVDKRKPLQIASTGSYGGWYDQ